MKENRTIIERGAARLSEIKEFFTKKNKDKGYYARGLVRLTERYLTRRDRRKYVQQQAQQQGPLKGWGAALIWAMCVVLLVNQYLLQAYVVPSGSMRNTLIEGDRLFVNKVIYGPELLPGVGKLTFRTRPERGNVIIFENPDYISKGPVFDIVQRILYMATLSILDIDKGNKQNHFFVKRAIGGPGDVVKFINGECHFKPEGEETFYIEADHKKLRGLEYANKRLIPAYLYEKVADSLNYTYYGSLNNMEVPVDVSERAEKFMADPANGVIERDSLFMNKVSNHFVYMQNPSNRMVAAAWWDLEKGQYVPRGSILPLGDNRDNSHDGRFFGTISKDDVLGRALVKYWNKPFNLGRLGAVK